jgi:outer membrane autotransporter protein
MFIGRELLTQVKLRWMNHITVLDEEADFSLVGGDETYQMALLNAPKSLVELGLGAQLRMNRSFSLLMGFDYETGGGYSANRLSAGVRYNF